MNKTRDWFFEKIHTIGTPIQTRREKTQITNTGNEKSGLTIDSTGVKR